MTYINIKDKGKMRNKWFRTKDPLYFKDTGQSWDILHWTDEEYQDFISKEYSDQKGQLERLNQVGTR
jgi:hypothetical protein